MPTGGAQGCRSKDLARAMSEAEQLELKVIVKADVQGSVEAVNEALQKLSTEKVKVTVVHAAVGAITEGDVNLAVAAGASSSASTCAPPARPALLAQQEDIEIRQYNVIYNVVDDVKAAMEGMLAPKLVEKAIGKAEVRQVFRDLQGGYRSPAAWSSRGLIRRNASGRAVPRGRGSVGRQAREPQALQGRRPRGQGRLRVRHLVWKATTTSRKATSSRPSKSKRSSRRSSAACSSALLVSFCRSPARGRSRTGAGWSRVSRTECGRACRCRLQR